jgi:hypothetical protein
VLVQVQVQVQVLVLVWGCSKVPANTVQSAINLVLHTWHNSHTPQEVRGMG